METYIPSIISIITVALIALIVKYFTKRKCKKPNGKRGALVSLTVSVAFSMVFAATIITRDPITCILGLLLALMIVKTKLDLKQFTSNQMISSAAIGIIGGAITWFIANSKMTSSSSSECSIDRDLGDNNAPKPEMDQRAEADSASDDLDIKTPTDDNDSSNTE